MATQKFTKYNKKKQEYNNKSNKWNTIVTGEEREGVGYVQWC